MANLVEIVLHSYYRDMHLSQKAIIPLAQDQNKPGCLRVLLSLSAFFLLICVKSCRDLPCPAVFFPQLPFLTAPAAALLFLSISATFPTLPSVARTFTFFHALSIVR